MYESFETASHASCCASWAQRRVNEAGFALIKEFEGLHLRPYQCPGKVWTIGYGHTRTVTPGIVITLEQAEQFLKEDVDLAARAVLRSVDVPLGDNQFAALCCFVFNVGAANFERSTLLTLLNRGWYEQVPAQLTRWNKVRGEELGGLARRRAAEGRLWNRCDETEDGTRLH